jgi:hypothetical protein
VTLVPKSGNNAQLTIRIFVTGLDASRAVNVQSPRQPVGQGDQGIRARPWVCEVPGQNRTDKFAPELAPHKPHKPLVVRRGGPLLPKTKTDPIHGEEAAFGRPLRSLAALPSEP